jgi:hypothetical protein
VVAAASIDHDLLLQWVTVSVEVLDSALVSVLESVLESLFDSVLVLVLDSVLVLVLDSVLVLVLDSRSKQVSVRSLLLVSKVFSIRNRTWHSRLSNPFIRI